MGYVALPPPSSYDQKYTVKFSFLIKFQLAFLYIFDRNAYTSFMKRKDEIERVENQMIKIKQSEKLQKIANLGSSNKKRANPPGAGNPTFGTPIGGHNNYINESNLGVTYATAPNNPRDDYIKSTASFMSSNTMERISKRKINNAITNYIQYKINLIDDETKIRFVNLPKFATIIPKVSPGLNYSTLDSQSFTSPETTEFERVYKTVRSVKCEVSEATDTEIIHAFYEYIDMLIESSNGRGLYILKNGDNDFTPYVHESRIYGVKTYTVIFRIYIEGFKDNDYNSLLAKIGFEDGASVEAISNKKNKNGRIYESGEYLPHLKHLKKNNNDKKLFGELDHPEKFNVSSKNSSHIIKSLAFDEASKTIKGKLRLMESYTTYLQNNL